MRLSLFQLGWFAGPLVHGDYPAIMKSTIARRSRVAGYEKSLLPVFSPEERKIMKGTLDFLGLNMYTSLVAKAINLTSSVIANSKDCLEVQTYQSPLWKTTNSSWLNVSVLLL